MALSTMQEIFILLEDEKQVPFFRLSRWGRPARGALSKLKSMGWVESEKQKDDILYKITPKGEEYLDQILASVKQNQSWDKKWRLVMFDIPETKRATRDKLRRALNSLGLGILQSSVWISPDNIKSEIEKIRVKFKLEHQLKFFEVAATDHLNKQIVNKVWNEKSIVEKLEKFIKDADWSLKAMGKGNGDRFNSKKLIFEYALILKKGPNLPLDFFDSTMRNQSHEIYLKLRRFAT